MSKQTKRKITVEPSPPTSSKTSSSNKDSQRRPSVFERLGTKTTASSSSNQQGSVSNNADNFCRQWAQNGSCSFGKNCKYSSTHTLTSPSKQRAAKKEANDSKQVKNRGSGSKSSREEGAGGGGGDRNSSVNKRLHSTVVVKKKQQSSQSRRGTSTGHNTSSTQETTQGGAKGDSGSV
ncbi:hypothetical protein J437_LFUL010927, partial [Ladona fulva]